MTTKIWVTKYLFTAGIIERETILKDGNDKMAWVGSGFERQCFFRPDWHLTREDAVEQAKRMIVSKRKSIQKQLAKVDEVERELKEAQ
jgi:hypothetical protein